MADDGVRIASAPRLEWCMTSLDQIGGLALGTVALRAGQQDVASAVLDAWRTAGGRLIDTAAVYGHGGSESAIGAWLRSRGSPGGHGRC